MTDNIRTLTFISRRAPYGEGYARACLDMVMASAVFDQKVNMVFMDDGVFQLVDGQAPEAIAARSMSRHLTALPLYGVDAIYVDELALRQRGLVTEELVLPVKSADTATLQALIAQSDQVFVL